MKLCRLILLALFFSIVPEGFAKSSALEKIKLPTGFSISTFATNVKGARSLTQSPNGTVFVGSRAAGNVYALSDNNRDGVADAVRRIASRLNTPNGVAFFEGALYVAEISRILKFSHIEKSLSNPPGPTVVYDQLPKKKHHGWKFIAFGPDGYLYVPVGAPCNVCLREDPRYAAILRMRPNGSKVSVYAKGVRNSVGFDWHPTTKQLWFTDNGRDRLGDNLPPDELNKVSMQGEHFGFPYCHGGDISDPKFGSRAACSDFTAPEQKLGPHVASLGMRFYTGSMFPPAYKNKIFIAERGSWNRSEPIGYRITTVTLKDGKAISYEPFATGWRQKGEKAWGRPVDVLVMQDGSLLVSDEVAGAIYRITYKKPKDD